MTIRTFAIILVSLVGATRDGSVGAASPRQAAQAVKPVTNADVVSMTAGKLSDDVIVGAIQQAATTEFDLSPAGLIALRNAGVSDRVLQAIQARGTTASSGATQPRAADGVAVVPPISSSDSCGIFITEEDPPSRFYVVLRKEVQAGKKFYGSHDDGLMRELAKQADKVGADAIIKFHEWRAPSMWSWAAAKAGGMAVKWTPDGRAAVSALKGQCWKAASD